jgi:hypothetical protein
MQRGYRAGAALLVAAALVGGAPCPRSAPCTVVFEQTLAVLWRSA